MESLISGLGINISLLSKELALFICEWAAATPSHGHGFGSCVSFGLDHTKPFLGFLTPGSSFLSPLSLSQVSGSPFV